jgi:hypothetical protein
MTSADNADLADSLTPPPANHFPLFFGAPEGALPGTLPRGLLWGGLEGEGCWGSAPASPRGIAMTGLDRPSLPMS